MSFIPLGVLAASGAGGGGSFESIATVYANGGETSLNLTSIPGTYKHLQLRWLAKTSRGGTYGFFAVRFNSDSSATYTKHSLWGDGANINATGDFGLTQSEITYGASGSTANANSFGAGILDLHDYSSTSKFKTYKALDGNDNNGAGNAELCSGLWRSTSAVTSINLILTSGTFTDGTKFALFGIKG